MASCSTTDKTAVNINFDEDQDHVDMTVNANEDEFMSEESSDDDTDSVKIVISQKQYEKLRMGHRQSSASSSSDQKAIQDGLDRIEEDMEIEFNPGHIRKRNRRSSSRESGEISMPETDTADTDDSTEDEARYRKLKSKSKKKKRHSVEDTLNKVQCIISKKGYVDADTMEKLTRRMNDRAEDKPKKYAGGGDRTPPSKRKGKVQFTSPTLMKSPSDMTVYEQAVRMKDVNNVNHKRPSTSSEDDIDMDCFDSSDEMDYLEHNSHQLMTDNFIADMKRHYQEEMKRSKDKDKSRDGRDDRRH